MNKIIIYQGDNRLILKDYPDAYFSSCVCDPPYELGFMGKAWDKSGIAYDVEMWQEVYRVLKPGAHLLAFGGSRTYHRLACAIEDAGFEIRDQIMWIYGSGFPKSLDVSKGIDKAAGAERSVVKTSPSGGFKRLMTHNAEEGFRPEDYYPDGNNFTSPEPLTDLARQWDGWGTALKPAHEPIVVARKPLEGTVVQNVLKHGCGGLNVAGCRIEARNRPLREVSPLRPEYNYTGNSLAGRIDGSLQTSKVIGITDIGRWPANVIHDGSEEVLACFPETSSGAIKQGTPYNHSNCKTMGAASGAVKSDFQASSGSAARFFYCAKASQEERNLRCEFKVPSQRDESRKEGNPGGNNPRNRGVRPVKNNHPTVKPLALMCYMVRLVTPPGGIALDHLCGSGSTLIAAAKEGFDAVGIDLEWENCEITARRCRGHLGMLAEIEIKETP